MNERISRIVSNAASKCRLTLSPSLKMDSWTEPSCKGRQLHKVAIVGVTASESVRHRYEDTFVNSLTDVGLESIASYIILPQVEKLTNQAMTTALESTGADSVIMTRTLGRREGEIYEPSVDVLGYYGFYDTTFDYMNSPGNIETYVETQLEADLYDVKSGQLMWTAKSRITDAHLERHNIKGEVVGIIKDLIKQGMIVPASRQ